MREWNAQTYIKKKAERMYKIKRVQYLTLVCVLVSIILIAPFMLLTDDKKIDVNYTRLGTNIRDLRDNWDKPEIALQEISKIRTSMEIIGLEPTDNSAYFDNPSRRDVQHFLNFLRILEITYTDLVAWRDLVFSFGFVPDLYELYQSKLEHINDDMYDFGADHFGNDIGYITYGAYLNKELNPISLFNFRFFALYYIPYILFLWWIVPKLKERLSYLESNCMMEVRRRYNQV